MALVFCSGYDRTVSGDDEVRARAVLLEMQVRITRGPRTALGLGEAATPEDVRAAFLALTKRFHPARFGRMSSELQRLSNEVFLGIKSAHDVLMGSPRPKSPSSSAAMPVIRAEASDRNPSSSKTAVSPRSPHGTRPTPAHGQPVVPTPARGVPLQRPASPPLARPTPPPPATRATTPPVLDERAALQQALDFLAAKSWAAARQALHTLAARVPQSKQYRALLCYTRGREAQAQGRADDATLEFQRALQLDPDLASAKQALAELRRR
jgi:hypothetical protein